MPPEHGWLHQMKKRRQHAAALQVNADGFKTG
jgi:hypothetical protein